MATKTYLNRKNQYSPEFTDTGLRCVDRRDFYNLIPSTWNFPKWFQTLDEIDTDMKRWETDYLVAAWKGFKCIYLGLTDDIVLFSQEYKEATSFTFVPVRLTPLHKKSPEQIERAIYLTRKKLKILSPFEMSRSAMKEYFLLILSRYKNNENISGRDYDEVLEFFRYHPRKSLDNIKRIYKAKPLYNPLEPAYKIKFHCYNIEYENGEVHEISVDVCADNYVNNREKRSC